MMHNQIKQISVQYLLLGNIDHFLATWWQLLMMMMSRLGLGAKLKDAGNCEWFMTCTNQPPARFCDKCWNTIKEKKKNNEHLTI